MSQSVLIFLVLVLGVGEGLSRSKFDGRIVGGWDVSIEDYPYQAALKRIDIDMCGAVIIQAKRVLTAAHCVHSNANFTIRCGTAMNTGGQEIPVGGVISHSSYNSYTYDYDIAVLILLNSIEISVTASPIDLCSTVIDGNRTAWVSGWGNLVENHNRPDKLHAVDVQEITRAVCRKKYPDRAITARMVCFQGPSGNKDACQGDSGSPLVDRTVPQCVIGIVSWGVGCGRIDQPGVYTSVAAVYGWIIINIE